LRQGVRTALVRPDRPLTHLRSGGARLLRVLVGAPRRRLLPLWLLCTTRPAVQQLPLLPPPIFTHAQITILVGVKGGYVFAGKATKDKAEQTAAAVASALGACAAEPRLAGRLLRRLLLRVLRRALPASPPAAAADLPRPIPLRPRATPCSDRVLLGGWRGLRLRGNRREPRPCAPLALRMPSCGLGRRALCP
jgi:hypothetical protein